MGKVPVLPVASNASSSGKKRKRQDAEVREVPGERCRSPNVKELEWKLRMTADCTSIPDWDSDAQHPRECTCEVCAKFYSDLAKSLILHQSHVPTCVGVNSKERV